MINVVVFRHVEGDELNRALPAAIDAAGTIFLRGTIVDGREVLRCCFMHHEATVDDVDAIVPAVLDAADRILTSRSVGGP